MTEPMVERAELTDLAWFVAKQGEIKRADADALKAVEAAVLPLRWEFGMQLLDERRERKQLPKGRMDEICNQTGISASEARHRMRLALRYPTRPEVSTAVETCGSWTNVRATLYTPDPEWLEAADEHARDQAAIEDYDAEFPDGQPGVARPMTREAEALEEALRRMVAGAREIERLMRLAPLVPFEVLVAEVNPRKLDAWLTTIRAAHDAVRFISGIQQKPPPVTAIGPGQLRIDVDGEGHDPDRDARVAAARAQGRAELPGLPAGDDEDDPLPDAVVFEPEPGETVAFDEDAEDPSEAEE